MSTKPTFRLTIDMSEETSNKLSKRAMASGLSINDFVVKLIEDGVPERMDALEQSMKHLESLVWRNIYWSALPYIEGVPKQRLNEQGIETYWNRSGNLADRFTASSEGKE